MNKSQNLKTNRIKKGFNLRRMTEINEIQDLKKNEKAEKLSQNLNNQKIRVY